MPVVRVDVGVRLTGADVRGQGRDLRLDGAQQPGAERGDPECEEDDEEGEQPELADAPAFGGALFSTKKRQGGG